jgi:hypothetical protein
MKTSDYNHLILYAKGWYERGDRVEDVRRILAIRAMLDKVSDADVWLCVVHALEKHCPDQMGRVMTDLFKPIPRVKAQFKFHSGPCSLSRALYYALGVLGQLPVKDKEGNKVLELGEPDEEILPFSNLHQERIIKELTQ